MGARPSGRSQSEISAMPEKSIRPACEGRNPLTTGAAKVNMITKAANTSSMCERQKAACNCMDGAVTLVIPALVFARRCEARSCAQNLCGQ